MRKSFLALIITMISGCFVLPAGAMEEPDLELGEEINVTCAGCHGEFGQGSKSGEYPRLAGMDARYLASQLRDFKSRKRLNIPMFPYTTDRELPEEDVLAVAAFLASIKLKTKMPPIDEKKFDALARLKLSQQILNIPRFPGNIEKGKAFYKKECDTCHGRDGRGKHTEKNAIPLLAGQYSAYIQRQIELIRAGKRYHDEPDDDKLFKTYSDEQISDMLAYLSILDDQ